MGRATGPFFCIHSIATFTHCFFAFWSNYGKLSDGLQRGLRRGAGPRSFCSQDVPADLSIESGRFTIEPSKRSLLA